MEPMTQETLEETRQTCHLLLAQTLAVHEQQIRALLQTGRRLEIHLHLEMGLEPRTN